MDITEIERSIWEDMQRTNARRESLRTVSDRKLQDIRNDPQLCEVYGGVYWVKSEMERRQWEREQQAEDSLKFNIPTAQTTETGYEKELRELANRLIGM